VRRAIALAFVLACVRPRSVDVETSPAVIDLHVDLPHAAFVNDKTLDDPSSEVTRDKLVRGHVRGLVLPLFVERAYELPPTQVREQYEATWLALTKLALTDVKMTLAFEGADGFADDPTTVDPWLARGACVFGLVHDHDNALAGSSSDPRSDPPGKGLTPAGRALAERLAKAHAILDVAHASDTAAMELVAIAKQNGSVAIDSHTGMRSVAPSRRNLDDEVARSIAAIGGLVGISMHSGHVSATAGNPATLDDVARHIEHALGIVGVDHVALGSDFDGLIVPPIGSDGEATWPQLWSLLRSRGQTQSTLRAIFGDNAARVLGRCP
jgi:membrane dipeptidase